MYKSASGAMELINIIPVSNITNALEVLKKIIIGFMDQMVMQKKILKIKNGLITMPLFLDLKERDLEDQ